MSQANCRLYQSLNNQLTCFVSGNGYIAASFDSRNGLYVRLNRALSVQVPFYPVIETMLEEGRREGM